MTATAGVSGGSVDVHPALTAMPMQSKPIATLMSGPAIPIQNSVGGSAASRSIWAIPPSAKSVIDRTGKPRLRATSACASSCTTIDTKNSRAVRIDAAQIMPSGQASFVS